MKRIIATLMATSIALPAFAQTSPGFTLGQVPTPSQWNGYFSGKQDYNPTFYSSAHTWSGQNAFTGSTMQVPPIVQLGGTTSSFPAIKRNGAQLQARLADDSDYADLAVHNLAVANFGYLLGTSDGVFRFSNNALNGFGLLQFGGTTSSFPAIKRITTGFAIRLADDSADSSLNAAYVLLSNPLGIYFGGVSSSFPALKRNGAQLQARLADDSDYADLVVHNLGVANFGYLLGTSDGVFRLSNNALNGFGLLQLGGTTSSFPAIKRNGQTVAFRLADDSLDAPITVASITTSGVAKTTCYAFASLPSATANGPGSRSCVTDATLAPSGNFGAVVSGGGGSNVDPLWSDGTNWRIG